MSNFHERYTGYSPVYTPLARAAPRLRPVDGEAERGWRRHRGRRIPGSVRAHLQQPARLFVGFGESSSPPTRGSLGHRPFLRTPGSAEFDRDANNSGLFWGDMMVFWGKFSAIQLISESNLGALKSI